MKKKRSIIPNVLTMGNMVMGFSAILYAARGDQQSLVIAGFLVFCGAVFDALDGAAARALHVESPIGVELDSLADGVSYGIAPGVIAYQAYLGGLPEIAYGINYGMLIAPIFPICAIFRLARFNVCKSDDHISFTGLPSPPAGVLIAVIPGLATVKTVFFSNSGFTFPLPIFIALYIVVALMMVSHVGYEKMFSILGSKGKVLMGVVCLMLAAFLFMFYHWAIFIVTSLYILYGLVMFLVNGSGEKASTKSAGSVTPHKKKS